MTKARDLANSAAAFSAVSATELGYVDGVTSAIQTQLDAKVAKTLTTTTGDMIYASGANTPARLGIGSSAQVLTVASGIPSWATASATSKPAFSATPSGNQSLSANTLTKIVFDTEQFDTAGNFASNRFTPTTAGNYLVTGTIDIDSTNSTPTLYLQVYKNGANYQKLWVTTNAQETLASGSVIINCNGTTDYIELYGKVSAGTGTIYYTESRFTGAGF